MLNSEYHDDAGHIRGSVPHPFEVVTTDPANLTAPFVIKRVFFVFATDDAVRIGQAHKQLRQLVIAVQGSCTFDLDDGSEKHSVTLDTPTKGLLLGRMVWCKIRDFSPDCVLTVLASEHFDAADIRIENSAQRLSSVTIGSQPVKHRPKQ
jgi:WxcM-like, C-terminal